MHIYIYKGEESKRWENGVVRKNEDRIVNGYQLDFGQPWYAGLGYQRDPRYLETFGWIRISAQCIAMFKDRGTIGNGINCMRWYLGQPQLCCVSLSKMLKL